MDITTLINNFGFPIACVIVMALYIREQQKIFREELQKERDEHKEEVKALQSTIDGVNDSLTNNTLVLQKLVDYFDRKE